MLAPPKIPTGQDTAQKPIEVPAEKPREEPMADLVRQYLEFQRLAATLDQPVPIKVGDKTYTYVSRAPGYSRLVWAEFFAMARQFDVTRTEDLLAARKLQEFAASIDRGDEDAAREIAAVVRTAQVEAGDAYAGERLKCLVRIVQLLLEPQDGAPDWNAMAVSAEEIEWRMETTEIVKLLDAWYVRDIVLQRNREKKILALAA